MFIGHCDFCDEFSNGKENAFARIYEHDLSSRVLFRSENFSVIPSLGQIVEGYLLVVPIRHYTALADMPTQLVAELSELCAQVRIGLAKAYGPCLFFEHGVRGKGAGGCGIEHAHLHAVPFTPSNEPIEKLKERHSFKLIDCVTEINQEVPSSSYLYYEDLSGRRYIFDTNFLPSQYARQLLAESIGIDLWDWRKYGREQSLISSLARLSESFIGHFAR